MENFFWKKEHEELCYLPAFERDVLRRIKNDIIRIVKPPLQIAIIDGMGKRRILDKKVEASCFSEQRRRCNAVMLTYTE